MKGIPYLYLILRTTWTTTRCDACYHQYFPILVNTPSDAVVEERDPGGILGISWAAELLNNVEEVQGLRL